MGFKNALLTVIDTRIVAAKKSMVNNEKEETNMFDATAKRMENKKRSNII